MYLQMPLQLYLELSKLKIEIWTPQLSAAAELLLFPNPQLTTS